MQIKLPKIIGAAVTEGRNIVTQGKRFYWTKSKSQKQNEGFVLEKEAS